jgi:mRNA-degrading endonuclease YafQ of YafQ-DinJ toxin-antitoxin module
MIDVLYTQPFIKEFNSLEKDLQDEVYEKIESFKDGRNHPQLKVHKLKGRLKNKYSFSVNYKIRIVFEYTLSKKEVALLSIGDHNVYKR